MTMEVTPERLDEIKKDGELAGEKSASFKEIQSLVGKLSFAATMVRAGHLFFSRILQLLKTVIKSG